MSKPLGKFLVETGVIDPPQLEEAIQNQVIYGGRLGTNMLELELISVAGLSKVLSKKHRLPTVNPFRLKPTPPELLKLIGKKNASQYCVVPLGMDGHAVQLLMADPTDVTALDEMQFATGKRFKIFVSPEVVVMTLLEKYYGVQRDFRYKQLAAKVLRKRYKPKPKTAAARAAQKQKSVPGIKGLDFELKEDLSSQEDFEELLHSYNRPHGMDDEENTAEATDNQAPPPQQPPPYSPPPQQTASPSQPPQPEPSQPPQQTVIQPPPPDIKDQSAVSSLPEAEEEDEILDLDDVVQEPVVSFDGAAAIAAQPTGEDEEEIIEDIPEALTLQEAMQRLNEVADRDELSRVVLAFALSYFKRAALFITRGGVAMGWDGLGGKLNRRLVEGIMLPLNAQSIFQTVHDSRAFFLGSIPSNPINDRFLKLTGDEKPNTVFLIPILFGGKVVNILYGDNGEGSYAPTDISDLLILAPRIPQAFETIIKNKKQEQTEKD